MPKEYSINDIIKIAKKINKKIDVIIDIHTPYGSVSAQNGETYYAKSYKTKQYVSTGAGDVWDAANMGGYLLNFDPVVRLNLANAAAAIYISNLNMEPPSIKQIISFLNGKKILN